MKKPTSLNRRHILAVGAAGLAAPFINRSAWAADGSLRILTWEGYADKSIVEPFEAEYGVKTEVVYVGSVDEMFAKILGSGGADFDVIAFDTSTLDRYLERKLVQPIKLEKLPNFKLLLPKFQEEPGIRRGNDLYQVPYAWGGHVLVYSKEAFPKPPESWEVMWDEQYAQQMIAQDDANNSIVLAAIVLGFKDPFNLTDDEFEQVKQKLIAQKRLLLTYYGSVEEAVSTFVQSSCKLIFPFGEWFAKKISQRGVPADFTVPKEGASAWLDCWCISARARNLDLAHAWINMCLDKKAAAFLTDHEGIGCATNAEANARIGLTHEAKLTFLRTPEDFDRRVKLWNEIKASI